MKFEDHIIALEQGICTRLGPYGEKDFFTRAELIIHEGHVPRVSVLLLDGEMKLKKGRKFLELQKRSLVGLRELIADKPCEYSVQVFPNTKIVSFSRSNILDLYEQEKSQSLEEGLFRELRNAPFFLKFNSSSSQMD